MISYKEFEEYYMFLDDYLFNVFEQIKTLNCFKIGYNTKYEGIIDINSRYVTISFVYTDFEGNYTDNISSLKIPSEVLFDDNALYDWIQINEVDGTFNT